MTIVLNPKARGGRAAALWQRIAPELPGTLVDHDAVPAIAEAAARGERHFVAAGGDGTVNFVLNQLAGLAPVSEFVLGAIGLGSSNDFHKPSGRRIAGIPVKIDSAGCTPRDVGVIRCDGEVRCFLLGASFGTAARGNALFDTGAGAVGWLKRRWTGGAIAWAALQAIAQHRNTRPAGFPAFANLSVMKSQYLSGAFRFDQAPPAGLLAVHLCPATSRPGLLRVLMNLARGRFSQVPGCQTWMARSVAFETEFPIAAEVDGEILHGRRFEISLLPERILVCA